MTRENCLKVRPSIENFLLLNWPSVTIPPTYESIGYITGVLDNHFNLRILYNTKGEIVQFL